MIINRISKGLIIITIIAMFAFTPGILNGVMVVSAESPDPEKPSSGEVRGIKPMVLERIYRRAQRMLRAEDKLLANIDEGNPKIQKFIDEQKEDGKDTTALETALEAFQDAVNEARNYHESASETLSLHEGFDIDGKVTDFELAKTTVHSAMEDMKSFNQAVRESHKAVREALIALRPDTGNE